jgi:hypothetical protein
MLCHDQLSGTITYDVYQLLNVLFTLSLSSQNGEVLMVENWKTNHGNIRELFGKDKTLLLGSDWPAGLPSSKLTANERGGMKRKHSGDMESDSLGTKKMRGIGPVIDFDFVFNH